ncbi:MAG: alpha-hydroxy-acid oxidizing protein [Acidimicrobiales bacterium]
MAPPRRLPRPAELRPLVRVSWPAGSRRARRLARAVTIEDLRTLATRRAPRAAFDYTDGGAESEVSMRRARAAFEQVVFHPRVLRDVSRVDPSTTVLGRPVPFPLVLAPTGFTRLMHTDGEIAVARAAQRAGVPYALSTVGTTAPEELAAAVPGVRRWFQLYVWKDRARSRELLARVRASGFDALVLTVDVPVAGARWRDVRNGMTLPPALTMRTVLDAARRPAWWFDFFTTAPPSFATLGGPGGSPAELINSTFDPSVTLDDIAWLRDEWDGPVLVKGIQTVADAQAVVDLGVDGIVVSNHGGRQLDRTVAPIELLAPVVDAVGTRCEVLVDGGVRSGADVAAAVALGARAVLVGRPYLYGLMAAGEDGVARAVEILQTGFVRTMQLLGVTEVAALDRSLVELRKVT